VSFPNQREFGAALEALKIDRSGRGLPLSEGVSIVYTSDIDHLLQPVPVPTRYGQYTDAAAGAAAFSFIEIAPPADSPIIITQITAAATTATRFSVGAIAISAGRTVLTGGFVTGAVAPVVSRQVVSSGDTTVVGLPAGRIELAAGAVFDLPLLVIPGSVLNVFLSTINTGIAVQIVAQEFPLA